VDGHWKLVTNRNQDHIELYEISTDPYEKNNRFESDRTIANNLATKVKEWQATLPTKPSGDVFSELRKNP
jgi:N-acetylgalactosamine-6-sulfatase